MIDRAGIDQHLTAVYLLAKQQGEHLSWYRLADESIRFLFSTDLDTPGGRCKHTHSIDLAPFELRAAPVDTLCLLYQRAAADLEGATG